MAWYEKLDSDLETAISDVQRDGGYPANTAAITVARVHGETGAVLYTGPAYPESPVDEANRDAIEESLGDVPTFNHNGERFALVDPASAAFRAYHGCLMALAEYPVLSSDRLARLEEAHALADLADTYGHLMTCTAELLDELLRGTEHEPSYRGNPLPSYRTEDVLFVLAENSFLRPDAAYDRVLVDGREIEVYHASGWTLLTVVTLTEADTEQLPFAIAEGKLRLQSDIETAWGAR